MPGEGGGDVNQDSRHPDVNGADAAGFLCPSAPPRRRPTFHHAAGRSVASPKRAFDTGLRPDPFPDRAASLLAGLAVATRTGLAPAGDDELVVVSSALWHHLQLSGRTNDRS